MSLAYGPMVNCSEVELRKNQPEFMDSNFCQMQQQQNSNLLRYSSAPSSFLASLLDNNGGGGYDDHRYVRPSSPEVDTMLAKFISACNGTDHSGSNGLHQFGESLAMKQETEDSVPEQNEYSSGSQMMYLSQAQQVHALHGHNSARSNLDSSFGVINSTGFEDSMEAKIGVGNRSNLVRQSSSPAGLFSDINSENGLAATRGFRGYKGEPSSSTCTVNNQLNFSFGAPSSSRHLPQISETENGKLGMSSPEGQRLENGEANNSQYIQDFSNGSWDDSSFHCLKRARDNDGNMFPTSIAMESQNTDFRNRNYNLTHHLSLPKNFEMPSIQKLLQFQGAAPCKIRAKRGFATHPRSIAERVRRTRISERMRKLQDLFPEMDKQTSTADMLDLAVQYIKDLQKQVKTLNDTKSKCSCSRAEAAIFTLENRCKNTIWPGILSGSGKPLLMDGGLKLRPGRTININAPKGWSGRFWGRRFCSFDQSGKGMCVTGDCGGVLKCAGAGGAPPATLAEFTLDSPVDFYDVSLVDGYNMPISIIPVGGSGSCKPVKCLRDLNKYCPNGLQVKRQGRVVACNSACMAFNKPEYCCTGAYGSPQTCKPTSYSRVFKAMCPTAYSYAYDDPTSTFTCKEANYLIRFC